MFVCLMNVYFGSHYEEFKGRSSLYAEKRPTVLYHKYGKYGDVIGTASAEASSVQLEQISRSKADSESGRRMGRSQSTSQRHQPRDCQHVINPCKENVRFMSCTHGSKHIENRIIRHWHRW